MPSLYVSETNAAPYVSETNAAPYVTAYVQETSIPKAALYVTETNAAPYVNTQINIPEKAAGPYSQ